MQVNQKLFNGISRRPPGAQIFVADRVWSQSAEQYHAQTTETRYNVIAGAIASGMITSLTDEMNHAVTVFYNLWNQRFIEKRDRRTDAQHSGVLPGEPLTKDQEEMLERNGYAFIRGCIIPGRFLAGVSLNVSVGRRSREMKDTKWGVVTSDGGEFSEFVVPDNSLGIQLIPVTPNHCLLANHEGGPVEFEVIARLNGLLVEGAKSFYFARDLNNCPIQRNAVLDVHLNMAYPRSQYYGVFSGTG